MTTLVVGASGATGRLLLAQLLARGQQVRAIVRSVAALPTELQRHPNLRLTEAALLDLSDSELAEHVAGCTAVASCLGHTLSFKGLYGKPRRLVTDATRRLCEAVAANRPPTAVKFLLMNTTGNRNRDRSEKISIAQHGVIGLLRLLLPPHVDNEQAAEYLRSGVGQKNQFVEWLAVRPDGLIDDDEPSAYNVHPSPIRSAIFNAGQTSRINVAHFMAELICDEDLWRSWRGQMPVIYNREAPQS